MKQRIEIWKELYGYARDRIGTFYIFFGVRMLIELLALVGPFIYIELIDKIMMEEQLYFLKYVIVLLIVVYVFSALLEYIAVKLHNHFFLYLESKIQKKLLQNYLIIPYKIISKFDMGDLKKRVTDDVESVSAFIERNVVTYVIMLLQVTITFFLLLKMSLFLLGISAIFIPFSFAVTNVLGKRAQSMTQEEREVQGMYERSLYNFLGNWQEIKFYRLSQTAIEKIKENWFQLRKIILKKQEINFWSKAFVSFKDYVILEMGMYFIGGLLIFHERLTLISFIAFMSYFKIFLQYVSDISENIFEYQRDLPRLRNVLNAISFEEDRGVKVSEFQELSLRNVSVTLNGNNILQDISLSVKNGEQIFLIGRNGSGKSTLLKTIMGLQEVSCGEIDINGIPLGKINEQSLYRIVRYLPQTPRFLNGSIRDNLSISNPDLTDEEIIAVCEKVDLWSYIKTLPKKLETQIGDSGVRLSGGQRQRLAIARVLLSKPEVLILDEITSSLDGENSQVIQQLLWENFNGKTMIQISHKWDEVGSDSKIIVMRSGRIWKNMNAVDIQGKEYADT